ncbi:MAG: PKD domain-containing protein, partial [Saprospiraceae bacterium]|nr:PKD domain-containing protein [Saprospiraceae bacterium]
YRLTYKQANGVINTTYPTENKAFKGTEMHSGGHVRLTLDKNFIMGFVRESGDMYLIEPLSYLVKNADPSLYVVYAQGDVIRSADATCQQVVMEESMQHIEQHQDMDDHEAESSAMACYQMELAIASDHLMLAEYGSVSGVEVHNIAVINDVQGNYNGWFIHDIEISIKTQFVSGDPNEWTSSTNAGTLLGDFADWGNSGNFGTSFDLGEIWTTRDFDGATVGIAFVGGLCTTGKYHALQDWSSNSEELRVTTAHEMGHNFNCSHDSGCPPNNFIMCPFVTTSSDWSTTSVNAVNSFLPSKLNANCLTPCITVPVVPDFFWEPIPACAMQPVEFFDQSTGPFTSLSWTFPGGSPSSSTSSNPTVTWNTPGTYNVKLTLQSPSGPESITKAITILPKATANFTYSVNGTTITFVNTSTNALDYYWDFGDGNGSFDASPEHTYDVGGFYTVVLSAMNDCGTSTKTITVNTAPTAEFSATPLSGCAPLTVVFNNESSSNSTVYAWQFPGGTPAVSNQANPTIVYANPGTYSVTLVATNGLGSDTEIKTNYITVLAPPVAGFTYSLNNLTATFTNTSTNGVTYFWNFGDGTNSTAANPVHTYAVGGSYTVTLTVTSPCGNVMTTQMLATITPPVTAFTASPVNGCPGMSVTFTNQSTGATTYNWQFPGGTPATSTAANPTVVYPASGVYSVTLTASNAGGTTTATQTNLVTVNALPAAGFSGSVSGTLATFTNTSTNATSNAWNFGDGATSTDANPTHTYTTDGVYTVTLTASNSCGNDVTSQTVTIVTAPTAAFTATGNIGCAPLTVQFNNTSSANATTFSWEFPGGTPATSTAASPVVTYAAPGLYAVTLTAGNSAGTATASQSNIVEVTTTPQAGFGNSVSGATASFTNTTTGATSYAWSFGDGANSTSANPSHTYATDGVYTVVLTATNNCGTATASQNVTIATPPTAGFTANNTNGCAPLTVQFSNTSSANATAYSWTFEGGTPATSTEANPTVVFANPGTYAVTLTTSNAQGSSTATQSNIITVNTTPSTAFSGVVNGADVNFTNTTVGATNYTWDFGDGTNSSAAQPVHTYATDGVYTVTLTATNVCGTTTASQPFTIVTPPTAGYVANNILGCAPMEVQFTNTSSSNTTGWAWSFPGGTPATSTDPNPTVVYDTPGTYSVSLTVSNAAGSSSINQTGVIQVNTVPVAAFTSQTAGLSVVLTNQSTGATSYLWTFGDGLGTSTEANPTFTFGATGLYNVTLQATNFCGTTETSAQIEIQGSAPIPAWTATPVEGCAPMVVQFSDQSAGNPTSWSWQFSGGVPPTSTDQFPVVTYNDPGVYDLSLTVTNLFGSTTMQFPLAITAITSPISSFGYIINGATVTFTNNSQGATGYVWNFGDGSMSSEANPQHVYTANGSYTVTLTAINTCGASTLQQTITVIVSGVNQADWLTTFRVYPNPSAGVFKVEMSALPASEVEFALFSILGQSLNVQYADFTSGRLNHTLMYEHLPAGVYNLRLRAGDRTTWVKLMIERQ